MSEEQTLTTESINRALPQKLPLDAFIVSLHPIPPGWLAYYHDPEQRRIVSAPIAMWALAEYDVKTTDEDDDEIEDTKQEVRPFIVAFSGGVMDYRELPYDVLCVVGPTVPDHVAFIRGQLSLRGIELGEDGLAAVSN